MLADKSWLTVRVLVETKVLDFVEIMSQCRTVMVFQDKAGKNIFVEPFIFMRRLTQPISMSQN